MRGDGGGWYTYKTTMYLVPSLVAEVVELDEEEEEPVTDAAAADEDVEEATTDEEAEADATAWAKELVTTCSAEEDEVGAYVTTAEEDAEEGV